MSKIKLVQIMAVATEGYERWEYLDDQGRLWTTRAVPDEDKCEYDELGRRTKSIYKDVWEQIQLPDDPTNN